MKFHIGVKYEFEGYVVVEADSKEQAEQIAINGSGASASPIISNPQIKDWCFSINWSYRKFNKPKEIK